MIPRLHFLLAVAIMIGFLLPSVALACLWDYDTIKMERTRFPSTLELITGKFLRHSPEFYQWRITDRLKRLEADPYNVALLDDLAVAYDKIGQHDKAIETAQKTDQLSPGRYETAANLGSFYFHAGKLKEGLPYIDKALRINPNAHFGREKYQKLLVEHLLFLHEQLPEKESSQEGKANPKPGKAPSSNLDLPLGGDFARFLFTEKEDNLPNFQEISAAVQGILGMMKFGKHDSPVLLETLGMLLAQPHGYPHDAKMLSARAYLKASYEVPEGPVRKAYRERAEKVLGLQKDVNLESLESEFQGELQEAKTWYARLRENELSWIRDGKNPETEFDKLYTMEPEVSERNNVLRFFLIAGGVFILGLAGSLLIRRAWRKRAAQHLTKRANPE